MDAEAMRGYTFALRHSMKGYGCETCENCVLATLFFEPSTRTRLSFESAMIRLGGKVISASDSNNLSLTKGESLSDTLTAVSYYADVIAVRASVPFKDWFPSDLKCFRVPIINAGDGSFNHPTQALLDAYTIWRHYGFSQKAPFVSQPLVHCIVGDLAKSRAIKSYLELMTRQNNHTFNLYDNTGQGNKVENLPAMDNVNYLTRNQLEHDISGVDVLYLNRIQSERWGGKESTGDEFMLTGNHIMKMKNFAMVLNPGPRREELPVHLTNQNCIKMWDQVENGVFLRMAILRKLLE